MLKKLIILLLLCSSAGAEDIDSLELMDATDSKILMEEVASPSKALDLSELEEVDDLESLKEDIGESLFSEEEDKSKSKTVQKKKKSPVAPQLFDEEPEIIVKEKVNVINEPKKMVEDDSKGPVIFDVGAEEQQILELSKFVETKIADKEWDEISTGSQLEKYVVQEGDWLWKISQKLFGSGFYYSKIWSLNPHITNPHEIEPGMVLAFDTGSSDELPKIEVSSFVEEDLTTDSPDKPKQLDFTAFGENVEPDWIKERNKLIKEGVYFQYASVETYQDLFDIGNLQLRNEYKKYDPPVPDIVIQEPGEQYDSSGFDKTSKISFEVKEGFYLNTFITTNVVQDLGEIEASQKEAIFVQKFDKIYVNFDKSVKVKPGDKFSIYSAAGKSEHAISDRKGFKYYISGQIKALRKINNLWECEIFDLSGLVSRKDRITVYTPKINKIVKTFNKRNIEAAIVDSFRDTLNGISFGDVVYLDRGRADGVELGNVFELYSFKDYGTERKITPDPTYKIGEAVVISLTDNFATVLVSNSKKDIPIATLALSKTQEEAARVSMLDKGAKLKDVSALEAKVLDELDVELNLDNISEDLLNAADKVQLTDDELEELERQEREKSIIKDHEKDLLELERLEAEIVESETALNESRVDEDKFLEQQNLNTVEGQQASQDPNAFESLNDIENEFGVKYMDEDINSKENPYGLTEFDLEEIDELLNSESL
ncbi:LysM peptidoglycan-binding domain-containing protein [Halobacteriovorax sp. HLS]|uniref:LysM peptidoglycan-binding domain-containing protein n=1 Tax=Halobacteriovorax sp. HLS TaxID=2234000 RepID=UPI0013E3EFF0|nr:LysM domain-containing protein [Halobacteriovorax sp. HLS]